MIKCPIHGQSTSERVESNSSMQDDRGYRVQDYLLFCSKCLDEYNARGVDVKHKIAEICEKQYRGHHWFTQVRDDPYDSTIEYEISECKYCGTTQFQGTGRLR
ncbi:MAG: hypothetical protein WAW61_16930 [Methylococcaceae bacterium]